MTYTQHDYPLNEKKPFWQDLKGFFKEFLCQNKREVILFLALLAFFLPYSVYIAFQTSIIDHPTLDSDLYLSYDNPMIVKYGRTNIAGHPFLAIFYYPFVLIGNALSILAGLKAKTVLFVLISSSAISLSCVYINRYLIKVVELGFGVAVLFTLFFAFTSTNLILAFTPESFTLASLFLTFSVYFHSNHIKNGSNPSFLTSALLANFFLGGVTITNMSKGVIPILFQKKSFWSKAKTIIAIGFLFVLLYVCFAIAVYYLADGKHLYYAIVIHQGTFTYDIAAASNYPMTIFSHFFGSPILFPELKEFVFNNTFIGQIEHQIREQDHTQWWQFAFIGTTLIALVVSFVKNFKNKFVQMLFLLMAVDIVIHCVMRFGMSWPFMYGAHWVYCVPLVLAWLYKGLQGWQAKLCLGIFTCLFVCMTINNFVRLGEFIETAKEMFPPL